MIPFVALGQVLVSLLSSMFTTKVVGNQPLYIPSSCLQSDLTYLTLKNNFVSVETIDYKTESNIIF